VEEVAAPVAEAQEEVATVETVAEASAESGTEAKPEAESVAEAAVTVASEETAPVSFEELFKLRPEIVNPVAEDDDELKKDKKDKKGKKSVEYQFDETRGEVVGRKKHKRGDGAWEEDI
jgi:hypothetical protein